MLHPNTLVTIPFAPAVASLYWWTSYFASWFSVVDCKWCPTATSVDIGMIKGCHKRKQQIWQYWSNIGKQILLEQSQPFMKISLCIQRQLLSTSNKGSSWWLRLPAIPATGRWPKSWIPIFRFWFQGHGMVSLYGPWKLTYLLGHYRAGKVLTLFCTTLSIWFLLWVICLKECM